MDNNKTVAKKAGEQYRWKELIMQNAIYIVMFVIICIIVMMDPLIPEWKKYNLYSTAGSTETDYCARCGGDSCVRRYRSFGR